jgi:hypothetical protein
MESFDEKNNLNLLLDNSAELTTEEIRNLLNKIIFIRNCSRI